MRKLLNTLYVTSPDSYLTKDGENIVVKIDGRERFRIPIHNIEGIVCFGFMGASPALMAACAQGNIALSFLTEYGKFQGRITGKVSGNVLLRRKQYRVADNDTEKLELSRILIAGKIANSKTVLQRAMRDHQVCSESEDCQLAVRKLTQKQKQALKADNLNQLRGIEGEAASYYFSAFDDLIINQKDDFFMRERNRRPPLDNVNALLSFLYTLLAHDVTSALESVGLDPCVGFLHTERPGRPSLALDMMEELRVYIVDRLVLSLINRRQVSSSDFIHQESGGVIMKDEARKTVLAAWQKRKQEEILHPFLNEKISLGLLPYCQALLLARNLRGDLDGYPVFLIK